MRHLVPVLSLGFLFASCAGQPPAKTAALNTSSCVGAGAVSWTSGLPVYDHIVIVVEENKDYDQIIGNADAPFINNTLKAEGANLTRMYGEEHHSQGNYFWLFSGSNQNVGFVNKIPCECFTAHNLGEQLIGAGKTFKGYSQGLPAIGSTLHKSGAYARKHVPWISFSNLGATTSFNLRFQDFPTDFTTLPTVSIVIPDLDNDMHDGSIKDGDNWLKANLGKYYDWAKKNNSLLILTFDEDSHSGQGLTDPAAAHSSKQNRIVTILAGARIKPGDYDESTGATHVNLLRTLEAMYGLGKSGFQQPLACKAGIPDDRILTDIFTVAP